MMNNKLLNTAINYALASDKQLLSMGADINHLTAIYPYYQDNKEVFVKVRFDKDGKKWIKPFYYNGKLYKLGEPKLDKKPLYMPKAFDDVVYIVEGEKCVHALNDIGFTSTTTGGATSINKCDLMPLVGHKCVIWRDNDDSGIKWQDELINALNALAITYDVIDITHIKLPNDEPLANKADCYDFIEAYYIEGEDDGGIACLIKQLPLLETGDKQGDDVSDGVDDDPKAILKQRKAQLQAVIAELAKLDDMELTLSLRAVANEFGIPQKKILEYVTNHKQGELIPNTTPYHEPITGQELYKALYGLIDDFMVIDEPYKVVFVLWVIFTYLLDHAEFAPLVWITSPEKQCGKSTLLGLFARVADKAITANSITPSALQRVVEKYRPCLLIDEIDANLDKNSPIWGVINGGHSKTANIAIKCNSDNGNALEAFSAYGAKVICGIGANLPAPTISRAIRFVLRRKTKDDKPTKRFILKNLPYAQTDTLKRKIKRWTMDNAEQIAGVNIPIFDINDRDYDNWEFLLQIASVLGVYDVAVRACLEICQQEKEPTQNERLLDNIREVMSKKTKLKSDWLLNELIENTDWEWANYNGYNMPMNKHQLLGKLKTFGIIQRPINDGNQRYKGYYIEHLTPIFNRYLSPLVIKDDNPFTDD